jgi:hypothetical protein
LQAPRTDGFLSFETNKMVEGHQAIWTWIEARLNEQDVGTFEIPERNFHLLPQAWGGFFIIDMHSPEGEEPLPLVFNFHKLYLAGFQQQNRWYLFDDADLLGSGHDEPENAEHWRYLGFNGGYHGDFSEMSLGISELIATYNTLSRYHVYRDGRQSQVEHSCMRLMVMLCEAWCFPF